MKLRRPISVFCGGGRSGGGHSAWSPRFKAAVTGGNQLPGREFLQ